ncbi:hypothetical protein H696_00802 [Fonticula alba]|uniref:Uncharacterized protein n=1 Tax=Fonticula alba TaxID=691883 RepID=A0A058ZH19_FONAL|nr:hypothetical protein H696_00802 [Fonticula alba]KCV73261.1 hypothetical protein H696_00802 [Fonticula alba]|eukprot:XP_009492962.1 hypothetical protein H696_00802 [Fonticula alba]
MLFEHGIELGRVETISDDLPDIVATLRRLSAEEMVLPSGARLPRYTSILTSGGIGSTHDDITYDGVAAAFNVPLEYHEPTCRKLSDYYDIEYNLSDMTFRMGLFPQGSEIISIPGLWVPVVKMGKVHVLPGIPFLFEKMASSLVTRDLLGPKSEIARVTLYTYLRELDLSSPLLDAQMKFKPYGVKIGSYPYVGLPPPATPTSPAPFRTRVSIEGRVPAAVAECAAYLEGKIETFRELSADSIAPESTEAECSVHSATSGLAGIV